MIWILVDSSTLGGIERHVATLAEALLRESRAAEIVLLAAHGANPWLQQLERALRDVHLAGEITRGEAAAHG